MPINSSHAPLPRPLAAAIVLSVAMNLTKYLLEVEVQLEVIANAHWVLTASRMVYVADQCPLQATASV